MVTQNDVGVKNGTMVIVVRLKCGCSGENGNDVCEGGNQNRFVKSIWQSDKLVFEHPDETFTAPPMTVDGRGQIQNRLRRHHGHRKPFPAVMIIIVVVLCVW